MIKICSVFFYEGYISIAPTIVNLSKILDENKYLVTIYGTYNPYPQPGNIGDSTKTIYFKKADDIFLVSKIQKFLLKIGLNSPVEVIDLSSFVYQYFIYLCRNYQSASSQPTISIGVDTRGSIIALLKFYLFKQKFIYLSLEINDTSNFKKLARIIGILERLAYRKAEGVIVQDRERFEALCEYQKYQHQHVFYLPNSTISSNLTQAPSGQNFFRDKFGLSKENFPYIILQAGMLSEHVLSKTLASTFKFIDKYSLILHSNKKISLDDPYIKSLQDINKKNLFLSLEPLPFDEIDKIFEAATIGLAFYEKINSNFTMISMASGKLSYYLKHGKPVLVSKLDSLAQLVEKYKLGVVIKNPADHVEIRSAIELILSSYDVYSKNAKSCFQAEFDFTEKIKPILSFMKNF